MVMKAVLITGANSYIGTSFEKYVSDYYCDQLSVDTIDMIDGSWRSRLFTYRTETGKERAYDCVFHVAGIAHADMGKVSEETKKKYYAVNTDLAIETAQKAKFDGVGQFILMSSMIVYGKQTHISRSTKPHPANFYGDSKWEADKGVQKLKSSEFTVTVLRPPMIYGKESKGNYPTLSKLARNFLVFPDYENRRSMLYIENLCEFLCQVMIQGRGGVFFPQNAEYSSTSQIVEQIGKVYNHRIIITKVLNPVVLIAHRFPVKKIRELSGKAFGDSWYEMEMSAYKDLDYQKVTLKESIERTEL